MVRCCVVAASRLVLLAELAGGQLSTVHLVMGTLNNDLITQFDSCFRNLTDIQFLIKLIHSFQPSG